MSKLPTFVYKRDYMLFLTPILQLEFSKDLNETFAYIRVVNTSFKLKNGKIIPLKI